MNETKNNSVKALKKQMAAAVAMVCVAAVALGSSTYAWFVTNNTVKATTSTISAQSNAAFMKIKYNVTATTSDLTADYATLQSDELYPAQWSNNFDATGTTTGTKIYNFETAYGTKPTADGYAKSGDWIYVGTPTTAVTKEYAVENIFNISSKGTDLTKLKVSGATILTSDTVSGETTDQGNIKLDDALRVLVTCGNDWVLCDKNGVLSDSAGHSGDELGQFGTGVTVTHDADTEIKMYVYYDGNNEQIYSNNLPNLTDASSRITVTFTATADNH